MIFMQMTMDTYFTMHIYRIIYMNNVLLICESLLIHVLRNSFSWVRKISLCSKIEPVAKGVKIFMTNFIKYNNIIIK